MAFWKKEQEDPRELIARKDFKRAIEIFRERVKKDPQSTDARMLLADALLANNQTDEAVEEYKRVAARFTESGFIAKAIAVYKKALRLSPTARDVEYLLMELSDPALAAKMKAESAPEPKPPEMDFENKLLPDLKPDEVRQVIARLALRRFPSGTMVVREGDPGESMFILVHGQVKVLTHDSANHEVFLAHLQEGDFFGEISMLTGKPRTATIITSQDSELLELTREDYEAIIGQYPHVKKVMERFHEQRAYKTVEALVQAFQKK